MKRGSIPLTLLALAGCAGAPFDPGSVVVHRTTASVNVHGRNGATDVMDLQVDLASLGMTVSYSDQTGVVASIDLHDEPGAGVGSLPSGNAAAGPVQLGFHGSQASLNGQDYALDDPVSRNALAAALDRTPLGMAFQRMLPFRTAVRARMAEATISFDVAALALAVSSSGSVTWPADYQSADDRMPPGLLPGDTIGLGMTCSTNIECPDSAPFCTTQNHQQVNGFCSHTCLRDSDCDVPPGVGRCGLQVTDIPDVQGSLQLCAIKCGGAGECPALLGCVAHWNDPIRPDLCFPPTP